MSLIRSIAKKVFSEMGSSLSFKVGTMIEIPRAALVADEVCVHELSLLMFPKFFAFYLVLSHGSQTEWLQYWETRLSIELFMMMS